MSLKAFEDPSHEGNGPKYHSGQPCHEKGCSNPAGTKWSPYWCFEHNVERMHRISKSLEDIAAQYEKGAADARRGYEDALAGKPKPATFNWDYWRGWYIGNKELNKGNTNG